MLADYDVCILLLIFRRFFAGASKLLTEFLRRPGAADGNFRMAAILYPIAQIDRYHVQAGLSHTFGQLLPEPFVEAKI